MCAFCIHLQGDDLLKDAKLLQPGQPAWKPRLARLLASGGGNCCSHALRESGRREGCLHTVERWCIHLQVEGLQVVNGADRPSRRRSCDTRSLFGIVSFLGVAPRRSTSHRTRLTCMHVPHMQMCAACTLVPNIASVCRATLALVTIFFSCMRCLLRTRR